MYRIYIVSFYKKPIAHSMIILCMVVFQSCAQFRPINVDINNYSYEINRDFWGVPHIKGATNKDIAFGIGYVHAEDAYEDLVQLMPLYKGENGIKNGIDGATTDYLIRLLKIHEKYDENGLAQLPSEIIDLAKGYVDGINYFAKQNPAKVNRKMHPVSIRDVLLGSHIQHLLFAGLFREIESLNNFEKSAEVPTGSNAIAVNGKKTIPNSSYLMINSHQPLSGPVGWYELNVSSDEGWQAHGGNFPGSFLVNVGFNKNIGWGATVNRPDIFDIYKLEINPNNTNQYKVDDSWKDFVTEKDSLRIRLLNILTINVKRDFQYSDFGPVIEIEGNKFAISHSTDNYFGETLGWFELNLSSSVNEFKEKIIQRKIPSFNFVAMDREQNIGYFYNGMIPKRDNPTLSRTIITTSKSKNLPLQDLVLDLPTYVNPENGWIQSTNQDPFYVMGRFSKELKDNYPDVDFETRLTNRSFRANEILESEIIFNYEEFYKFKHDNQYSKSSRQFKYLQKAIKENPKKLNKLSAWNLKTNFQNRLAGMSSCIMAQEWLSEFNNQDLISTFDAIEECKKIFSTIDKQDGDEWKNLTTISRGDRSHSIQGSVDTLRAVYGVPNKETQTMDMSGGDGLFFIVAQEGDYRFVYGMHNFGSSRVESSPHFADQTFLFSQEAMRFIPSEF